MESSNGERISEPGRRTYGVIIRGLPEDFASWIEAAKAYDLMVVYSKTSKMKIRLEEVPFQ